MSDETANPKPKLAIVPADALDLSDLWLDSGLGDGITDEVRHSIPFGKPRDYFRLHPDPAYRRKVEIYRHKTEDAIDEEYFVFAGNMQGTPRRSGPLHARCLHLSRRHSAHLAAATTQGRRA